MKALLKVEKILGIQPIYEPKCKETDGIIREIQKHPVAFKNVATMMEVMNYLTDVSALQAAGADYTGVSGKNSPTPQEVYNSD